MVYMYVYGNIHVYYNILCISIFQCGNNISNMVKFKYDKKKCITQI
jgi:hypothetical protein